jgi:arylsulfatase A
MHRRSIMVGLALTTAGAALPGCAPRPYDTAATRNHRPNIVLIMADDVGIEGFGIYGGTSYQTPRLDALAATGVRFTQCHAQPLCTPSRVKIMTGKSNIRNYSHFSILDPDQRTFGHMLQDAGYTTFVAGKWQLLGASQYGERARTGSWPRGAGFDGYCLWQVTEVGSRYWDPHIFQHGYHRDDTAAQYGPDIFVDAITDFIDRDRPGPFFVYYPMALVHTPNEPTPFAPDADPADKQARFADMMQYADAQVGRIVDHLARRGLRDETIIIFTSDNGTTHGIVSELGDRSISGGKGRTDDTGTHVPLIVNWPGHTPRGATCDDLVDFSDVLPTLAELAGVDAERHVGIVDGRSFLPQIMGEPGDPRGWLYCYYNPRPGNPRHTPATFARNASFKLYTDERLFDLRSDPMEEHPIAPAEDDAEQAAARAELEAVFAQFPSQPIRIPAAEE